MDRPADSPDPVVLVVEDDRAVRDLIEVLFAAEGIDVRTARDGLEGLLKLRMHRPAVVVLDIMMPDVGGLRVLDELAEEHSDTPVIVVTGKPEAADEARKRLGNANVFNKPFEVEDLLLRVQQIVGGEG
ncbi:DNA-binding response regulator [Euzebya pacifica]|uniref:DNA-binding response regulator n=1 Tax=Euzebya pacifica TaxID=1608957 RepID=A0A346XWD8_9ACTN|nr:response regulator [Euzebya pacifica]AXV06535.1 DNA-binding response regulator [Euzebya pacifica]